MDSARMSLYVLLVVAAAVAVAPCRAETQDVDARGNPISIDSACRYAADGHSFIRHEHCVESLASDPRSAEAGDFHGLAVLATKMAIEHAASTEAKVEELAELEDSPHARARFNHCLELYGGAADAMRDALDNLHARLYGKAAEQLGAALGAAESCEDVWKGEERVPIATHDKEYGPMAMIALGLTNSVD